MAEIITSPYIPERITVHLGDAAEPAENVTVPFIDYVKNVASSELYPTWSDAAIRANVLAQVSYALNRVYLEYYRSRGYDFEITGTTAQDQCFVYGRNTFESIDAIVEELFSTYLRRPGFIEPLAAKYCDGVYTTCNGMSQWGSEALGKEGYNYMNILNQYYGYDLELVSDAPVRPVTESYPGYPLQRGSTGPYVRYIQVSLNRIARNYPGIPLLDTTDGIFGEDTEEAVRIFQRIFGLTQDGIVGRSTWYQLVLVYTSVKRLSELNSEGQQMSGVPGDTGGTLFPGERGEAIRNLQYYLNVLSQFYRAIPAVVQTEVYDSETETAVFQAQGVFELPRTGIADPATRQAIENAVTGIGRTLGPE